MWRATVKRARVDRDRLRGMPEILRRVFTGGFIWTAACWMLNLSMLRGQQPAECEPLTSYNSSLTRFCSITKHTLIMSFHTFGSSKTQEHQFVHFSVRTQPKPLPRYIGPKRRINGVKPPKGSSQGKFPALEGMVAISNII
jgi:hypothetical protein